MRKRPLTAYHYALTGSLHYKDAHDVPRCHPSSDVAQNVLSAAAALTKYEDEMETLVAYRGQARRPERTARGRPDRGAPLYEWLLCVRSWRAAGAAQCGETLKAIPCAIVHGRHDVICPVGTAYAVHKAWPGSQLRIVEMGAHALFEKPMRTAAQACLLALRTGAGSSAEEEEEEEAEGRSGSDDRRREEKASCTFVSLLSAGPTAINNVSEIVDCLVGLRVRCRARNFRRRRLLTTTYLTIGRNSGRAVRVCRDCTSAAMMMSASRSSRAADTVLALAGHHCLNASVAAAAAREIREDARGGARSAFYERRAVFCRTGAGRVAACRARAAAFSQGSSEGRWCQSPRTMTRTHSA